MDYKITVDNLTFKYGSSTILEEISFALKSGEFVGIVGPNGSGKSTLLKNMAALLTAARGDILLDGRSLGSWSRRELARQLALVGQGSGAGFNFLVEDVVAMGRHPYQDRFSSISESDRQAVGRAMHLTGCYHLRERQIFTLSGGEQQRVILARALAQETPCLLLDEPTSFLDLGYQIELLELLQSLNSREQKTVVVVMHDLNLAARYCRRLFMLHQGKIYASGTPEAVLTRKNILEVYRTEVLIEAHPLDSSPQVVPVFHGRSRPENGSFRKIHIIGGGGSATPLIKELSMQGLSLSAGVLSIGDSDWATARRLGLDMVEEDPFSPISEIRYRENLNLVDRSDVVVVAPLFIGPGNLRNLEAACLAIEQGLPVYLVDQPPFTERNFSGTDGEILYNRLLDSGAVTLSQPDLVKLLLSDSDS